MDISSFNGILEADETYFLYSEKGKSGITHRKPRKRGGAAKFRGISREQVCVLVARDREKNTVSKVSCQGRISIKQVNKLIGSKVSESDVEVVELYDNNGILQSDLNDLRRYGSVFNEASFVDIVQ
ncbi:hypothetical protein SAMN02746098_00530 [Desulfosporosinus lacus DSM 15449]|uniref:ISXO2-like transposase domain-containing protein n=1 Tax=Desulfosporosinus lacus DSM 15449 TaxID=1121420 RepID=A0A1M5RE06_9FIRM|nr:hypothetical protein SAMN02746098_00530 [Desulfosporosinus lacus DSM 15449]